MENQQPQQSEQLPAPDVSQPIVREMKILKTPPLTKLPPPRPHPELVERKKRFPRVSHSIDRRPSVRRRLFAGLRQTMNELTLIDLNSNEFHLSK